MEQYEEVSDFSIYYTYGQIWLESEKYEGAIFLSPLDCHKLFEIEGDNIIDEGSDKFHFKKSILLIDKNTYDWYNLLDIDNEVVSSLICIVKD